jgi:hypothetical protein
LLSFIGVKRSGERQLYCDDFLDVLGGLGNGLVKHFEHGVSHFHGTLEVRQILLEDHRYHGILKVQFQAGLKPFTQGFQGLGTTVVFQSHVCHLNGGMYGGTKGQDDADALRRTCFDVLETVLQGTRGKAENLRETDVQFLIKRLECLFL